MFDLQLTLITYLWVRQRTKQYAAIYRVPIPFPANNVIIPRQDEAIYRFKFIIENTNVWRMNKNSFCNIILNKKKKSIYRYRGGRTSTKVQAVQPYNAPGFMACLMYNTS
jgi:hypothetical protein